MCPLRPKIIFLDLEGTLLQIPPIVSDTQVAQSAWTTLAGLLGADCLREEEETKRKWEAKTYFNYLGWMEDTIRIHRRYGLTSEIFEGMVDLIQETPGIRTAAERFHAWGAKLAIISGGFKALANKAQIAMKAQHSFAACEYFFDAHGNLSHWNLLPTDYRGKLDFMKLLINEYAYSSDDCVFVGDGNNDVTLAKGVGLSIAFNAQKELRDASKVCIDQLPSEIDFVAVADVIELYARH